MWSEQNCPPVLSRLPRASRRKAIDLANFLHFERGYPVEYSLELARLRISMWIRRHATFRHRETKT